MYFAEIGADGVSDDASPGVTAEGGGDGSMDMNFPVAISACNWQGTISQKGVGFLSGDPDDGEISLKNDLDGLFITDPKGILVETRTSAGVIATMPVSILVICGLP